MSVTINNTGVLWDDNPIDVTSVQTAILDRIVICEAKARRRQ